ncbi:hypothetical protein N4P33_03615 [Streptomyces sp. 15-116A]|uniref:hypothetical protein n=1 Tax=Streptomyces sp. 15-116A TaxID=2259035 RepID=UPI0021B2CBD3|nr:hypothetical protein [Streptomyces sp. 15-116A]MCT7351258.1 hypothetical protein [Streptomyces sp. 15-116A]
MLRVVGAAGRVERWGVGSAGRFVALGLRDADGVALGVAVGVAEGVVVAVSVGVAVDGDGCGVDAEDALFSGPQPTSRAAAAAATRTVTPARARPCSMAPRSRP